MAIQLQTEHPKLTVPVHADMAAQTAETIRQYTRIEPDHRSLAVSQKLRKVLVEDARVEPLLEENISVLVGSQVCQAMVTKRYAPYQRVTRQFESALFWYVLIEGDVSCWKRADKPDQNGEGRLTREQIGSTTMINRSAPAGFAGHGGYCAPHVFCTLASETREFLKRLNLALAQLPTNKQKCTKAVLAMIEQAYTSRSKCQRWLTLGKTN